MASLQQLPSREGRAVKVGRGQALKIINTFGTQVVDFWAFAATDLGTYLSMQHTRSTLSRRQRRIPRARRLHHGDVGLSAGHHSHQRRPRRFGSLHRH